MWHLIAPAASKLKCCSIFCYEAAQWHALKSQHHPPLKTAPSNGRSEPLLVHGSVGLPPSISQMVSWSIQPFYECSPVCKTHIQTNRLCHICSNRPPLTSAVMQPNNKTLIYNMDIIKQHKSANYYKFGNDTFWNITTGGNLSRQASRFSLPRCAMPINTLSIFAKQHNKWFITELTIRESGTLNTFKRCLKSHLFNNH